MFVLLKMPYRHSIVAHRARILLVDIIVQLYANNEIRLKVQTEAATARKPTDKTPDRQSHHRAVLLEEGGDIRQTLRNCFDKPVGYRTIQAPVAWQLTTSGERSPVDYETAYIPIYPASQLLAESDRNGYTTIREYKHIDLVSRLNTILDITKKSQRPSSHASWGKAQRPKAFGSNARHRILESGSVIDRAKPRDSTYELTLTLPGSTPEAIAAVAAWSGWIVNRQLQSIRRIDKSIRPWWFFVWEFQKRGALHQHWCLAADTPELAYTTAMEIRQLWYKCLQELFEKCGVDCFQRKGFGTWRNNPKAWQWHCQAIKKSVAAYFSKYCGKDSKNVRRESKFTRLNKIQYPSRWWGSSTEVKLAVKQWRLQAKLSGLQKEFAEYLRCSLLTLVSGLAVTKQYQYDFDIGGQIPTNRAKTKSRRVSYASGSVWILYIQPDRFPDIWNQFRDIVGTAEERAKGNTIMQAAASIASERAEEHLEYKPWVFSKGADTLP